MSRLGADRAATAARAQEISGSTDSEVLPVPDASFGVDVMRPIPRDFDPSPVKRRWLLDGVDFAVDAALGMTIRGRFDRVDGSYEAGPDGIRIEAAVEATSVDTGNGIWDGLLRSVDSRALTEHPQARFTSTHVREVTDGKLRVVGQLEAAGQVEPVAVDAAITEVDDRLRLEAAVTIDRQRLGNKAAGFAIFLPATVHLTLRFSP